MTSPGGGEPRLVVNDLACERGGRLLFEGLSVSLTPGDALVVEGPNGSGKSSLLRIMGGHAATVWLAYGVTIAILVALVVVSLVSSRRRRRNLERLERELHGERIP